MKPIEVIAAIRIGIKSAEHRFVNGGCFQLYRILKQLYPNAEAWYSHGHVYTKINEGFYDINGCLEVLPESAIKLESEFMLYAKAHEWDFK